MFKVGDEIIVKSLGYDNKGRLNLSRKEALPKPKRLEEAEKAKDEDKKEEKKTTRKRTTKKED